MPTRNPCFLLCLAAALLAPAFFFLCAAGAVLVPLACSHWACQAAASNAKQLARLCKRKGVKLANHCVAYKAASPELAPQLGCLALQPTLQLSPADFAPWLMPACVSAE